MLRGVKKTAEIPILNVVPENLVINLRALTDLRDAWSVPPELRAAATLLIDENGVEHRSVRPGAANPAPRS